VVRLRAKVLKAAQKPAETIIQSTTESEDKRPEKPQFYVTKADNHHVQEFKIIEKETEKPSKP
jgi:hypothetical protein